MTRIIDGQRRFGCWGGCPDGQPEDPSRCTEEVWGGQIGTPRQCSRRRGHGPDGLYCKQHANKREWLDRVIDRKAKP